MTHSANDDVRSVTRCYKRIAGKEGHILPGTQGADAMTKAVEPKPTEVGQTPIPKAGDHVSYRAMDGTYWHATVMLRRADGTLDIQVSGNPPLDLSHRPWHAGEPGDCPKRACTAKEQAERQR